MMIRVTKFTSLILVVATLLANVANPDEDKAGIFELVSPDESPLATMLTQQELPHGVRVQAMLDVGPVLLDPESGALVRWVRLNTHCTFEGVSLEDQYVSQKVDANSSITVQSYVGPLDTGRAYRLAAGCLGLIDAKGNMLVESPNEAAEVGLHVVTVAPREGEAWASVTSSADLVISTSAME